MQRLQELTEGKGVERAIDCVAGELGAEIARNLAPLEPCLCKQPFPVIGRRTPANIHHAALRSAFDLFDSDGSRVVASAIWVSSQPLAEVRAATSDLLTMLSKGVLTPPAIVGDSVKDFQEAVRLADGEPGQQTILLDFSERSVESPLPMGPTRQQQHVDRTKAYT